MHALQDPPGLKRGNRKSIWIQPRRAEKVAGLLLGDGDLRKTHQV